MSKNYFFIKGIVVLSISWLGLVATASTVSGPDSQEIRKLTMQFHEMTRQADSAIPRDLLQKADCYAQIEIYKAGFIVGGATGQGIIACRNSKGMWTAPAFVSLDKLSLGWQWGLQKIQLGLVFYDVDAIHQLTDGTFELGTSAALTAGPLGRELTAGVDFDLQSGVISYAQSKGLFIGIAIEGTMLKIDNKQTMSYYGMDAPAILTSTHPVTDAAALEFIGALSHY